MGLRLTRREGEEIHITLQPGDLESLLRDGITVRVSQIDRNKAHLEIIAPRSAVVVRGEIAERFRQTAK